MADTIASLGVEITTNAAEAEKDLERFNTTAAQSEQVTQRATTATKQRSQSLSEEMAQLRQSYGISGQISASTMREIQLMDQHRQSLGMTVEEFAKFNQAKQTGVSITSAASAANTALSNSNTAIATGAKAAAAGTVELVAGHKAAEVGARAVAAAHREAATATELFRDGVHVLHPLLGALGLQMGELTGLSRLAHVGLTALGVVIGTIIVIEMIRAADAAQRLTAALNAVTGNAGQSSSVLHGLESGAAQTGISIDALVKSYQNLSAAAGGNFKVTRENVEAYQQAQLRLLEVQQRVANSTDTDALALQRLSLELRKAQEEVARTQAAVGSRNIIQVGGLDPAKIEEATVLLGKLFSTFGMTVKDAGAESEKVTSALRQNLRLTLADFDKLSLEGQQALTRLFNPNTAGGMQGIEQFRRQLETANISTRGFVQALTNQQHEIEHGFEALPLSLDRAIGMMSASWEQFLTVLAGHAGFESAGGALTFISTALDEMSQHIDGTVVGLKVFGALLAGLALGPWAALGAGILSFSGYLSDFLKEIGLAEGPIKAFDMLMRGLATLAIFAVNPFAGVIAGLVLFKNELKEVIALIEPVKEFMSRQGTAGPAEQKALDEAPSAQSDMTLRPSRWVRPPVPEPAPEPPPSTGQPGKSSSLLDLFGIGTAHAGELDSVIPQQRITDAFATIDQAAKQAFDDAKKSSDAAWGEMVTTAEEDAGKIKQAIDEAKGGAVAGAGAGGAADGVEPAAPQQRIDDAFSAFEQTSQQAFTETAAASKSMWASMIDDALAAVAKLAESMDKFVKIPSDAMAGKFSVATMTPGILTEEDVFRQDTARAQEALDGLRMAGYALQATGMTMLARLIPETLPGQIAKLAEGLRSIQPPPQEAIRASLEAIGTSAQTTDERIKGAFDEIDAAVGTGLTTAAGDAQTGFEQLGAAVEAIAQRIVAAMKEAEQAATAAGQAAATAAQGGANQGGAAGTMVGGEPAAAATANETAASPAALPQSSVAALGIIQDADKNSQANLSGLAGVKDAIAQQAKDITGGLAIQPCIALVNDNLATNNDNNVYWLKSIFNSSEDILNATKAGGGAQQEGASTAALKGELPGAAGGSQSMDVALERLPAAIADAIRSGGTGGGAGIVNGGTSEAQRAPEQPVTPQQLVAPEPQPVTPQPEPPDFSAEIALNKALSEAVQEAGRLQDAMSSLRASEDAVGENATVFANMVPEPLPGAIARVAAELQQVAPPPIESINAGFSAIDAAADTSAQRIASDMQTAGTQAGSALTSATDSAQAGFGALADAAGAAAQRIVAAMNEAAQSAAAAGQAAQQASAQAQQGGGGGGGGAGGASVDSSGDVMSFATGGSFTVGGVGGTDSQVVRFLATPGEVVSISTPGAIDAAGTGADAAGGSLLQDITRAIQTSPITTAESAGVASGVSAGAAQGMAATGGVAQVTVAGTSDSAVQDITTEISNSSDRMVTALRVSGDLMLAKLGQLDADIVAAIRALGELGAAGTGTGTGTGTSTTGTGATGTGTTGADTTGTGAPAVNFGNTTFPKDSSFDPRNLSDVGADFNQQMGFNQSARQRAAARGDAGADSRQSYPPPYAMGLPASGTGPVAASDRAVAQATAQARARDEAQRQANANFQAGERGFGPLRMPSETGGINLLPTNDASRYNFGPVRVPGDMGSGFVAGSNIRTGTGAGTGGYFPPPPEQFGPFLPGVVGAVPFVTPTGAPSATGPSVPITDGVPSAWEGPGSGGIPFLPSTDMQDRFNNAFSDLADNTRNYGGEMTGALNDLARQTEQRGAEVDSGLGDLGSGITSGSGDVTTGIGDLSSSITTGAVDLSTAIGDAVSSIGSAAASSGGGRGGGGGGMSGGGGPDPFQTLFNQGGGGYSGGGTGGGLYGPGPSPQGGFTPYDPNRPNTGGGYTDGSTDYQPGLLPWVGTGPGIVTNPNPPDNTTYYVGGDTGGSSDYGNFATGGEFTVKGFGGIDTSLVKFMATPGEIVTIKPPGADGLPGSAGEAGAGGLGGAAGMPGDDGLGGADGKAGPAGVNGGMKADPALDVSGWKLTPDHLAPISDPGPSAASRMGSGADNLADKYSSNYSDMDEKASDYGAFASGGRFIVHRPEGMVPSAAMPPDSMAQMRAMGSSTDHGQMDRAHDYGAFVGGGTFTVRGFGGIDTSLVRFHATPGEVVTITPAGERPPLSVGAGSLAHALFGGPSYLGGPTTYHGVNAHPGAAAPGTTGTGQPAGPLWPLGEVVSVSPPETPGQYWNLFSMSLVAPGWVNRGNYRDIGGTPMSGTGGGVPGVGPGIGPITTPPVYQPPATPHLYDPNSGAPPHVGDYQPWRLGQSSPGPGWYNGPGIGLVPGPWVFYGDGGPPPPNPWGMTFGISASTHGFVDGGDFTVPGFAGGRDSKVVSINTEPGERVFVVPNAPGGGGAARGGGDITINVSGVTDAKSFIQSMPQVKAAARRALADAQRDR